MDIKLILASFPLIDREEMVMDSKVIVKHVVLETFGDGGKITIGAEKMQGLIGAASTHAEFSALPIADSGWQKYFDDWKAKGIIT